MQGLFSRALLLSWAVWFGGLIGVLLSVTTIFDALAPDRHAAGAIARQVFRRSDLLVLTLAATSVISSVGTLLAAKTKSRQAVFAFLVFAALLAVGSGAVISPKINAMASAGTTDSPEFKKLHGLSMVIALAELISLAGAGLCLPAVISRPAPFTPSPTT